MSSIATHFFFNHAILCLMICADTLGRRLAALRKEKKLPQIVVAEAVGISRSHLAEIEGGKDPGFRTFCDLADYFQVSLDYLYRGAPALVTNSPDSREETEEILMIEFWRSLSIDERKLLLGIFTKSAQPSAA